MNYDWGKTIAVVVFGLLVIVVIQWFMHPDDKE